MDEDRIEVCPECGLEVPWGTVVEGKCMECGGRQMHPTDLTWVQEYRKDGVLVRGHWRRIG